MCQNLGTNQRRMKDPKAKLRKKWLRNVPNIANLRYVFRIFLYYIVEGIRDYSGRFAVNVAKHPTCHLQASLPPGVRCHSAVCER